MNIPLHSKIINKVAREVLKPIGVKQKGQSRTWLDDNGWWISVIEFQPSSWSKGTYLNFGVNWQWYPRDYFSFDFGNTTRGFVEYKTDEQFESEVRELAELAKSKVLEMRDLLATPESAKGYIITSMRGIKSTVWGEFHPGIACVRAGDIDGAVPFLKRVIDMLDERDWVLDIKCFTANILSLIESGQDYNLFINDTINESRKLKKLEAIEFPG